MAAEGGSMEEGHAMGAKGGSMEEGGRAGRPAAGAQATRAKLLRRVERERRQQVREEEGRGVGGRTGERERACRSFEADKCDCEQSIQKKASGVFTQ